MKQIEQNVTMLSDHFPLYNLVLRTPRLELRLPDLDELSALADLAAEGVHDPDFMPFLIRWTELPPVDRARSVLFHHWRTLGAWETEKWKIPFTVFRNGEVVGLQEIAAASFNATGEFYTGSWLGLRHQGQHIGTEMRAAVLNLGFAGLGAVQAVSGALEGNDASLGVSRKLGYRDNGTIRRPVHGQPVVEQRLRLPRADWQEHATTPVEIEGLEPCLPLLKPERD